MVFSLACPLIGRYDSGPMVQNHEGSVARSGGLSVYVVGRAEISRATSVRLFSPPPQPRVRSRRSERSRAGGDPHLHGVASPWVHPSLVRPRPPPCLAWFTWIGFEQCVWVSSVGATGQGARETPGKE
jgi:hypothetical protein